MAQPSQMIANHLLLHLLRRSYIKMASIRIYLVIFSFFHLLISVWAYISSKSSSKYAIKVPSTRSHWNTNGNHRLADINQPSISSVNRQSILYAKDKDDMSGVYQYTGTDPPPIIAKLFGIRSKATKEKPSNRLQNASKSRLREKQMKEEQAMNDMKAKYQNKYSSSKSKSVSIEELERQLQAKYKSVSPEEDFDDDDDEEDDESSSEKLTSATTASRFRKSSNDQSSASRTALRSDDEDDDDAEEDNDEEEDPNVFDLTMFRSVNDLTNPRKAARMKLFERMQAKRSGTLQPRSSSSSTYVVEDEDTAFDADDAPVIRKSADLSSKKKATANAAMSTPSYEVSVDSSYRFRKPPASAIAAEEEMQRREIIEKKAKEELKQVKIEEAKLRRKEELKTDFLPFDFIRSDDDDEASSMADLDDFGDVFSDTSFEKLGVSNPIVLKNLEGLGIFTPTKIQSQIIPFLLQQDNPATVMQAMTGSGKTLGFLIPMIDVIDPSLDKVQAVILAPSRELVLQIEAVAMSIFQGTNIRTQSIIGGANVRNQIRILREERPHLIVATPGRLAEIVFGMEKLGFGMVRAVVVDEVDNMLDEPFVGELETILLSMPAFNSKAKSKDESASRNSQRKSYICFASATGNDPKVKKFTEKFPKLNWMTVHANSAPTNDLLANDDSIVSPDFGGNIVRLLPSTITHALISTPRVRALEYLRRFLNTKPIVKSALIFVNDPHRVELLCEQLLEMGMIAAPLHGDTSKDDRKEIIARLRDGRVNLVVSTELAARGLDIPNLTHVINFELPTDANHYVHRAGRCGRAGREGLVLNFANPNTKFVVRRFGKQLRIKIRDAELREGRVFLRQS
jgi:ATP-dependent RNA helicase DeaD